MIHHYKITTNRCQSTSLKSRLSAVTITKCKQFSANALLSNGNYITAVHTHLILGKKSTGGPLSLSVGWENGPERGLKTVSFNP